jgi:DNA-directed RNA polymerase beta' subunit
MRSSLHNFIDYTKFTILTDDEIKKISVENLTNTSTIKKDILDSVSIGPNRSEICIVCKESYENCLDHFSYIENVKLPKILFLKKIKNILSNICFNCLNFVSKKTSVNCSFCKESLKYSFEIKIIKFKQLRKIKIYRKFFDSDKKKVEIEISMDIIIYIFNNISQETSEKLGFINNHPRDLFWNNYLFLGKNHRKLNYLNGRFIKPQLSNLYYQFIKLVENIKKNTEPYKNDFLKDKLQTIDLAIFDGEKYSTSSINLNTLVPLLVKKKGYIINDIITRRITNVIRAIITPANVLEISLNQIGIPEEFAKKIIIFETVTKDNYEKLNNILHNKNSFARILGKVLTSENGSFSYDTSILKQSKININDYIARTLIENDICTANRQPTLTKGSILGYYAKITKGKSIELNTLSCKGFNADFDGDAMNLFFPVKESDRNEVEKIMLIDHHIISSSTGKLITGIVQDHAVILYNLTNDIFFIDEERYNIIIKNCRVFSKSIKKYTLKSLTYYYGKDVFSLLIPENFNYKKTIDQPNNIPFIIENGFLISGCLNKSLIMSNQKGLIDAIDFYYGRKIAVNFINNMMNLSHNMMEIYGLTTSLRDFYFSDEDVTKINKEKDDKYIELFKYISEQKYLTEELDNIISLKCQEISINSENVMNILNKGFYHFDDIINSGAKGEKLNILKSVYTIGQIFIGSKRFNDKLYYIAENDVLSKYNFGIITNSYLDGLDSSELAMSHKNGVYSITQQQIETAGPGYLNKQMNEVAKNFIFYCDYTIRYSDGTILLPHCFNSFKTTSETTYGKIKFNLQNYLSEENDEFSIKYNSYISKLYNFLIDRLKQTDVYYNNNDLNINLPFDFELILLNIRSKSDRYDGDNTNGDNTNGDENKYNTLPNILKFIDKIILNYVTSPIKEIDYINKYPLVLALIYYLHPKNINLNKIEYDQLYKIILTKIKISQIEPSYGILLEAVSSFTSGSTQSLLSSLHSLSGGNSSYKNLVSNLRTSKKDNNIDNIITTYIDKKYKNIRFNQITINDLIDKIDVYYKNVINYNFSEGKIIKNINNVFPEEFLYIKLFINENKLKEEKLLLPLVYYILIKKIKLIDDIDDKIILIHINYDIIDNSIIIILNGFFDDVRFIIDYFLNIIKNINIKDYIFSDIFIEKVSKNDTDYKCYIKGINYIESLSLNFINKKYILSNLLYNLFLKYGTIGYFFASYDNLLKSVGNISSKYHQLIASIIIYDKNLASLTRQGLNKISVNSWDGISFETQLINLANAAITNSTCSNETLNSQSIYGIAPKIGSGMVKINFDVDKYNELYPHYKINSSVKKNNIIFEKLKNSN